jgi:hypothetical protein
LNVLGRGQGNIMGSLMGMQKAIMAGGAKRTEKKNMPIKEALPLLEELALEEVRRKVQVIPALEVCS